MCTIPLLKISARSTEVATGVNYHIVNGTLVYSIESSAMGLQQAICPVPTVTGFVTVDWGERERGR